MGKKPGNQKQALKFVLPPVCALKKHDMMTWAFGEPERRRGHRLRFLSPADSDSSAEEFGGGSGLNGEHLARLEVQPCLSARQYLEIMESNAD